MSNFLDSVGLTYLWGKIKATFVAKADISPVSTLDIDSTPTANSGNLVTSGGVYNAIPSTYAGSATAGGTADRTSAIPFGEVDSTSTSTAYTATVAGITELVDGTCVLLQNGVVTSAANFTININGLGAKPSYNNMATGNSVTPTAPTRDTTIFNINYTMLFIYSSTLVSGGAWICYRGYDANTNTVGYQLRTNSYILNASDGFRYYVILFTSADGTKWVPANSNKSNSATTAKTVVQTPINPFGEIVYCGNSTNYSAGSAVTATAIWQEYTVTLGYSFNRTGAALTLTTKKPVYVKCAPQTDGSAIIDSTTPYVQDLPTTDDGKIYILLGMAYSATAIELLMNHPVYYHKDGAIRVWTNAAETDISGKANIADLSDVAFSGDYDDLTDKPTIPQNLHVTLTASGDTYIASHTFAEMEAAINSGGIIDLLYDDYIYQFDGLVSGSPSANDQIYFYRISLKDVGGTLSQSDNVYEHFIYQTRGSGVWTEGESKLIGTASTSKTGVVKLDNTVTSTSTSLAATANAVRLAYNNGGVQSVNGQTGAVSLTIPDAVTESTVSGWGFTKNTGTVTSVTLNATSPIAIDSSAAITTSGTRTISHANSGVTAGTYKSVTVDAKGHVTSGTNPTTLSGYGITDAIDISSTAQTKSGNLTAAKFITSGGTSSQFVKGDGSLDIHNYMKFKFLNPSGTYLASSGRYLKLTMPFPTRGWMMTLGVVIYSGYVSDIYYIGGYNYQASTKTWYSPSVIYLSSGASTKTVYFGKNDYDGGDNKLWVALPMSSYSHASLMQNSSRDYDFDIQDIEYSLLDANPENWDTTTNGTIAFTKTVNGTGGLPANSELVHLAGAETISGVKTFTNGLKLNTGSSWTNSDRTIPFGANAAPTTIQYVSNDANTGLTYNPSTGTLKAGSFVKRGGTSSQFLKADGSVDSNTYLTSSSLSTYAPLASPAFSGTPTAPTAAAGTNTTQIATTAFVQSSLSDYDKKPLVIEVNDTDTIVPSGTYANITAALAAGRDVVVKLTLTEDVDQIFNCRIIEDDSFDGSYLFGYCTGKDFATCAIDNTNNLTIELDGLSSIYASKSHAHGNIQPTGTLLSDITISNGDKLVITDANGTPANKIARASLSFDGSTTTKALTPKGTWETFLQTAPVTSVNGSTGAVTVKANVQSDWNATTGDAVILNKPTIPSAVTESTVSGWGFTKNVGTITGVTGSNGLTGSGTSGSVTISHAAPSTSPAKTTQAVYPIKIDQYGHITAAGTAVTIPTVPTNVSAFTNDAGYATDMNLSTISSSSTSATLSNTNTYYRHLSTGIGTLNITLPNVSSATKVQHIMLYIKTGSSPTLNVTSSGSATITYVDGFEIEASKEYEISFLWNGAKWIVAYNILAS